jgi:hypothetical protein
MHCCGFHMSYNIMLMNKQGEHHLVQVAPDSAPLVTDLSASTNHQGNVDWPEHAAFTKTIERELYLHEMLAQENCTADQIAQEFLKAPLFNRKYSKGFGTIYTAVYRPREGALQLMWPGITLHQSFTEFNEGLTTISYSEGIDFTTTAAIPVSQLLQDYNGAIEAYWLEYGHSRTSNEPAAGAPLNAISQRIKELLTQMESLAAGDGTYAVKQTKDLRKRVGMKK